MGPGAGGYSLSPYLKQGHRIEAVEVALAPAQAFGHLHPHHLICLQVHGEDARIEILKGHPHDEQAIAPFHPLAHRCGASCPFVEAQAERVALIQEGFGTEAGGKGPALPLQYLQESALRAKTEQFNVRQHHPVVPGCAAR